MPISGCSRPAKPSTTPAAREPGGASTKGCPKEVHKPALIENGAEDLINSAIYKTCPDDVKDDIKSKVFSEEEQADVNEVLDKMSALMACKNQPVKQIGRTDKAISKGKGGCESETSTYGEWFADRGTLILTDAADEPLDFSDARTQFKGTLAHELTHGLTNGFDPRTCTVYDNFRDNPLMQEWGKAAGWDATLTNLADPSKAPTDYAKKNAKEDLSETIMMYMYSPDELKKKSPERYEFAKKLLEGGA
jgi:hypothetical protein